MEQLDLEYIRQLCRQRKIVWREHALNRMSERDILKSDVKECIYAGEVIENYPQDHPVLSGLVMGLLKNGSCLHVVCSIYKDMACIIPLIILIITNGKRICVPERVENRMNCFMCKGDIIEMNKTYVAALNNCVIIVKDVPAMVCSQCGEVYYSDEVSDELEKIVNTLKRIVSEVAIVDYKKAC